MGRDDLSNIPSAILEAIDDGADIELTGDIDRPLLDDFLEQLREARSKPGDVTLCITSAGGDPDLTRRIVLEVERARKAMPGRFLFLGKSQVYSAAVSAMAAFPCRDRYLTRDTILLIHCRRLDLTLDLVGPLRLHRPRVEALLGEIDTGIGLEEQDFHKLIGDSGLDLDEVVEKAIRNWYLTASEAREFGLVAGVV